MLPNAFADKVAPPSDEELKAQLGPVLPLWTELLTRLRKDANIDGLEWGSSSPKLGWALRAMCGKRNIVYLAPSAGGGFRASFALGDRAMASARACKFPKHIVKILDGAKHYVEGSAVRIEVATPGDIDVIVKLAVIKQEPAPSRRSATR